MTSSDSIGLSATEVPIVARWNTDLPDWMLDLQWAETPEDFAAVERDIEELPAGERPFALRVVTWTKIAQTLLLANDGKEVESAAWKDPIVPAAMREWFARQQATRPLHKAVSQTDVPPGIPTVSRELADMLKGIDERDDGSPLDADDEAAIAALMSGMDVPLEEEPILKRGKRKKRSA